MLLFISMIGLISMLSAFMHNRFHLLNLLIALEGIMLMIIIFFYSVASIYMVEELFLILLTLAVSEATLGLTLLIYILRSWGNDFMSSLGIYNW